MYQHTTPMQSLEYRRRLLTEGADAVHGVHGEKEDVEKA